VATYLLIHGAWYGAWCWAHLTKELNDLGHQCLTPDLPGHGADPTPPARVTFQNYLETLLLELKQQRYNSLVVVGHSFGALIAQSLTEVLPTKIDGLVFLAGNVAPSGCSLLDIVVSDSTSLLGPGARTTDGITSWIKSEAAIPALFNLCSRNVASWAATQLCSEPVGPWKEKIHYGSEKYRATPKFYVECTEDKAVTPWQQQTLRKAISCDFVASLEADHSPFLSCPRELARILDSVGKKSFEESKNWRQLS
jgi:pimeloyl-ACP methyl ester carboxylesterase